jgi:hypothetical protein
LALFLVDDEKSVKKEARGSSSPFAFCRYICYLKATAAVPVPFFLKNAEADWCLSRPRILIRTIYVSKNVPPSGKIKFQSISAAAAAAICIMKAFPLPSLPLFKSELAPN